VHPRGAAGAPAIVLILRKLSLEGLATLRIPCATAGVNLAHPSGRRALIPSKELVMKKHLALLAVVFFATSALAQPASAPSAPSSAKSKAAADCPPRHDHRVEKQQIGPSEANCAASAPAKKTAKSGPPPHDHRKEK
jgi:hypothetical protein